MVTFIDPNFDPKTRSTKVRIEVDNPPATRRCTRSSRASCLIAPTPRRRSSAHLGEALVVPRSAVLRDGRRSVVYVESASGEYEQRSVKTGRVGDEGIEILEGVKEGERVVAQGNLMIDAEAQLRGSVAATQSMSALAQTGRRRILEATRAGFRGLGRRRRGGRRQGGPEVAGTGGRDCRRPESRRSIRVLARLKAIPKNPAGSDLKALRQSFLPWSTAGADLALALKRGRQDFGGDSLRVSDDR